MGELCRVYSIKEDESPLASSNKVSRENEFHLITVSNNVDHSNNDAINGGLSEANPREAWLPITESRNGNVFSCVFHLVSSGIGFQSLLLPVAFASLGWVWGIITLSIAFAWQLYTIWLLVQLHETAPGPRYSRYLQLAITAFGPKLGKLFALFPVMYLSGGTCVMLIITAGGAMKLLLKTICDDGATCDAKSLTGTEMFLVFTCVAIVMAQRPNLNSVAGFSLIGAVTAITYCTLLWVLPISKDRPDGVSHQILQGQNSVGSKIREILNALGIIVLAFRGHNLVLEIQGTLHSDPKQPARKPMWRGVIASYILVAMCLFPLAIAGFWSYGNKVTKNGGLLSAFTEFHGQETSKFVKSLIYILVIINSLCSFQLYAMPVFDNLEFRYTSRKNKRCSKLIRTGLRLFFGGLTFFISFTFPFLPSLAALIGGITLPLTFAYPCFMWIKIKRPPSLSPVWFINLVVGCLGMFLSALLVTAAVWTLASNGLNANFFRP